MSDTFHFSSKELIRSCPLPKTMYSHKSRNNDDAREVTSLTVKASRIEPLSLFLKRNKKHLSYGVMEQLVDTIGRQLHQLEIENKGIASFNVDDITVFQSDTGTSYFAITNEDKIYDIDEDNQLTITAPYQKEYTTTTKNVGFHSPEFKEFISKKTIPYSVHFKSGYYSFGLLCIYCYISRTSHPDSRTSHPDSRTTDLETLTMDGLERIISPIINTKIYWFLKKMLHENPSERRYICV
jgi:hypothetical protein